MEPVGEFWSHLFTIPGKGGWTFATVPEKYAPSGKRSWGRFSVRATVDGQSWDTSVWRSKDGKALLPIPKRIRGDKTDGDRVRVRITFTL
jgi:hypothetical protein